MDNDGNILYLSPSVNHVKDQARLIWTRFDVTGSHLVGRPALLLYRLYLPLPLHPAQVGRQLQCGRRNRHPLLGHRGRSARRLHLPFVNEMRMWSIPDWNSAAGVQQAWDYKIPFTEEQGYSQVQNASFGTATSTARAIPTPSCMSAVFGMDVARAAWCMSSLDQNNNLITQSRLFLARAPAALQRTRRRPLLLRMANGSNIIELYAANSAHTQFGRPLPRSSLGADRSRRNPHFQSYSGISVLPHGRQRHGGLCRLHVPRAATPPNGDISGRTWAWNPPSRGRGRIFRYRGNQFLRLMPAAAGDCAVQHSLLPGQQRPSTGSAGLAWPWFRAGAIRPAALALLGARKSVQPMSFCFQPINVYHTKALPAIWRGAFGYDRIRCSFMVRDKRPDGLAFHKGGLHKDAVGLPDCRKVRPADGVQPALPSFHGMFTVVSGGSSSRRKRYRQSR